MILCRAYQLRNKAFSEEIDSSDKVNIVMLMTVRWNCVEMSDVENDDEIEMHWFVNVNITILMTAICLLEIKS